jgi:hydroxyacylglutathione hydrolase
LDSPAQLWWACWDLLRIGYELPQGWLAGGMTAWRTAAKPIATLPQWTVWDLQMQIERDKGLVVLDVRQPKEWVSGHIRGAMHITGAELTRRIDEVPKDRPIAVICSSGYRSSVAASVLMHHGYKKVFNVLGGMSAWKAAGLPVTTD